MSPLSARFSSSSRSMRSMKDFSCSPATPPTSAMIPPLPCCPRSKGRNIAIGPLRCKVGAVAGRISVVLGGGEGGFLLGAGLLLKLGPPLVIRHAVDHLPRFRVREREAALLGLGPIPFRQAVPAKAGQVHQIDVLDIGPLAQMLDEAAKRCRFEFGAGLVVHRDLQIVAKPYVALHRA